MTTIVKNLKKTEITGFDISKSITIVECLIKTDGSYEEWGLCSRRSRAMRLEKYFPPPPGWQPWPKGKMLNA